MVFVTLAFAMPFAQSIGQSLRVPIHLWHELHITVGTAALSLAAFRLVLAWMRSGLTCLTSSAVRSGAVLQWSLLGMIIIISVLGVLAFRQPVLGAKMKLLGLWTFPETRSLLPGWGSTLRLFHWVLSYCFFGRNCSPYLDRCSARSSAKAKTHLEEGLALVKL